MTGMGIFLRPIRLHRLQALQSYDGLPSPVWILGFPKGRLGAFRNLEYSPLGAA